MAPEDSHYCCLPSLVRAGPFTRSGDGSQSASDGESLGRARRPMQFRPEIDYYEILQVHPRASPEIIKKAYRTLMGEMRAHPDLGGDVERAKLINEAYRVLGDEDLRRAYDRARAGRTAWGERGGASPAGGGVPGVPGLDLERLAGGARKVILTVAVVITGLILARVLRNPALDLADLIAMLLVLLRIWGQVSTLGRT